ncbi:DNA-directed primase/polymerase protein-like [Amphiura filiformis]|uniref:DNA-directed primase/polymerase protein-like n=1 Tax=Amphiura filiformis TaxID=82378 RepID=UPI003B21327A
MSLAEERKRAQQLWLQKLKKFAEVESWYKRFPLLPEYSPRLMDPSPLWHTFPRQKQAFDFTASHPEDIHVFAKEEPVQDSGIKGLRRYFVTNYPQLWHVIRSFADLNKHASFYEVIPEGAACKLYFDLEFSKELNPDHDGSKMVKTFTEFVCQQVEDTFHLKCKQRHIIDFDASTESKFSRHLIFNLPKAAFKDNINAGNFVHHICDEITKQIAGASTDGDKIEAKKPRLESNDSPLGEDLCCLMIKDKNGEDMLFVDQGVYTRNRNFRLYKCSKLNKENPLELASSNTYMPRLDIGSPKTKRREEYQLFLDSIISNVRFSSDIQVLSFEGDESRRKTATTLGDKTKANETEASDKSTELLEGFHHSPYPDIDKFIRTCVTQGGVQGDIRRWLYFTRGQMIIYDISKNRWCGNIGRQHKSNNIMILVDLKSGIYYQKCHDPVCKTQNYKSPEHPIPPDCLPAFFDEFEDDVLLAATQQAEQDAKVVTCVPEGGAKMGGAGSDDFDDDELLAATQQIEQMQAQVEKNEEERTSGRGVGSNGVRRTLGGGDEASWQQQDNLDITDDEMLAAMSELEDSGIESTDT